MQILVRCACEGLAVLLLCSSFARGADESRITLPESAAEDDSGWRAIFDGKTLKGWDGDLTYWRVENGAIVGETTRDTLKTTPSEDSFIIWRAGEPANFELRLQYRISSRGNGGVQYRSKELKSAKWVMRGYQWYIDGPDWWRLAVEDDRARNPVAHDRAIASGAAPAAFIHLKRWTGQVWEDNAREMLAMLGQIVEARPGRKQAIGSVGDVDELIATISNDWNDLRLIARGNELIHILNGRVMSILIDDDPVYRRMRGELGLQVHTEIPMKIEYRNIRLKSLP